MSCFLEPKFNECIKSLANLYAQFLSTLAFSRRYLYRTQQDVCDAWDYGADIVTTGLPVINEMIHHPKTNESYDGFMKDFAAWIK